MPFVVTSSRRGDGSCLSMGLESPAPRARRRTPSCRRRPRRTTRQHQPQQHRCSRLAPRPLPTMQPHHRPQTHPRFSPRHSQTGARCQPPSPPPPRHPLQTGTQPPPPSHKNNSSSNSSRTPPSPHPPPPPPPPSRSCRSRTSQTETPHRAYPSPHRGTCLSTRSKPVSRLRRRTDQTATAPLRTPNARWRARCHVRTFSSSRI